MPIQAPPALLTVEDLQEQLQVSRTTVWRMRRRGELPGAESRSVERSAGAPPTSSAGWPSKPRRDGRRSRRGPPPTSTAVGRPGQARPDPSHSDRSGQPQSPPRADRGAGSDHRRTRSRDPAHSESRTDHRPRPADRRRGAGRRALCGRRRPLRAQRGSCPPIDSRGPPRGRDRPSGAASASAADRAQTSPAPSPTRSRHHSGGVNGPTSTTFRHPSRSSPPRKARPSSPTVA